MEEEAKQAYQSLSRMLRDLEKNLDEGEAIGVAGFGPTSKEFYVQQTPRTGPLISIIGDTDDGDLEQLVFAPYQISLRLFTAKRSRKVKPIGFTPE